METLRDLFRPVSREDATSLGSGSGGATGPSGARAAASQRETASAVLWPELPSAPHSEAEEGRAYLAPQEAKKPGMRGRRTDTRERSTDRKGRESATGHFFRRFGY